MPCEQCLPLQSRYCVDPVPGWKQYGKVREIHARHGPSELGTFAAAKAVFFLLARSLTAFHVPLGCHWITFPAAFLAR